MSILKQIDLRINFNWAIRNGFINYLKYLKSKRECNGQYDETALEVYARAGHLETLKFCHEHIRRITRYYKRLLEATLNGGHLDVLKYLHLIGFQISA
ncbi:MAG: hypothetical protein RJA90_2233 [Bacteroidota bacterium]|jgi:hypothetical protein